MSDGLVDEWFILSSETEFKEPMRYFESADILFVAGRLRVLDLRSGEIVDLVVKGQTRFPKTNMHVPIEVHNGYGLSHNSSEVSISLIDYRMLSLDESVRIAAGPSTMNRDPYNPDYGDGGDGNGGSCSSGGVGSTSCSVTSGSHSCSVTCQSGYYACCNTGGLQYVTCSCKKND